MRGLFGALADGAGEIKSGMVLSELPWLSGIESRSGAVVNWKTALEVTTVLACARVIAEGIAQVPLKLYRSRADRRRGPGRRPRTLQPALSASEQLADQLRIPRDHGPAPGPDQQLLRLQEHRRRPDLRTDPAGAVPRRRHPPQRPIAELHLHRRDGRSRTFAASEIWHVRGPSWNSWMGMEAVKLAREAIGLAIELETAHARLHKNGVQPSGAWTVEGNPDRRRSSGSWSSG
jgi:hypothetical protein